MSPFDTEIFFAWANRMRNVEINSRPMSRIQRIRPLWRRTHSYGTHTRPLMAYIIGVCPWNMVKFVYELFFFFSFRFQYNIFVLYQFGECDWKTLADVGYTFGSIRKWKSFIIISSFIYIVLVSTPFHLCPLYRVRACVWVFAEWNRGSASDQKWMRGEKKTRG